jgi:hypothetical protein
MKPACAVAKVLGVVAALGLAATALYVAYVARLWHQAMKA